MDITTTFRQNLLPAVTITDADDAVPVAQALLKGGLDVMEITLRTPAALQSIENIARHLPEMTIGAGTVRNTHEIQQAVDCGARFGLAPGFDKAVVNEAQKKSFPFIPGIMTPSEIEQAVLAGCNLLKVFPVSPLGGPRFISSLLGPYTDSDIRLIPMGGIDAKSAPDYCQNPLVLAAGGSWMTPSQLIEQADFDTISAIVENSIQSIKVE
mgnify:CR=1 FL=1